MFKWFKENEAINETYKGLAEVSNTEKRQVAARENARRLAHDLSGDIGILRQFFDITPKIGKFGITEKGKDGCILTMQEEFMPGVMATFYTSHEGVMGFEFIEVGSNDSQ